MTGQGSGWFIRPLLPSLRLGFILEDGGLGNGEEGANGAIESVELVWPVAFGHYLFRDLYRNRVPRMVGWFHPRP